MNWTLPGWNGSSNTFWPAVSVEFSSWAPLAKIPLTPPARMCSMSRSSPAMSSSSRPRSGVITGGIIPVSGNFISNISARFHKQNHPGAQQRHRRRNGERERKFHVVIAHPAECDGGARADADAHEIHESVAGGAMFGSGDLAKDGHVVAIEKSPTDAEYDHERDGGGQAPGKAEAEQRRHEQQYTK